MGFVTKVDLSYNRQIKERPRTESILSGATQFGIPFSALTSGPDYSSEIITSSAATVTSTFTGTSASTVYTWFYPNMVLGEAILDPLTPANSGITQNTDSVYSAWTTTTIDGNPVALTYSGVSFDITPVDFVELAPNLYSGSVITQTLYNLSAGTLDYTGRTIWSDTKGISKTEKLIVSDNPTIGYVLTCVDNEGMVGWFPSSGGTSGGTDTNTFVTGGTCSGLDITFTNSTGGTFTVTGCTSSGGAEFWTGGTGTGTIVLSGSNSPERSGNYSIVGGYVNSDFGDFNITTGVLNFNRGNGSIVVGQSNDLRANLGFVSGFENLVNDGATGSAIVGGGSNVLGSGATGSAIIGGFEITGTSAFTTYVPNLNIDSVPESGSTSDDVLVRSSDGTVKVITQASLSGGTTGATIDVITTATTSAYTITNTVNTIFMDCTSNDVTATLPSAAANPGLVVTVVRQDNTANNGLVDVGVSDLVQMTTSVNIVGYSSMTFISNGIDRWWIK